MFGSKKVPDEILRRMAQEDRQEALIYIFRRHYVDARNRLLQRNLPERLIEDIIEKAAVAVWLDLVEGRPLDQSIKERFFHYIDHPDQLAPPEGASSVEAALQQLYRTCDPECMQLVMWRYGERRPYSDIGRLMDIPPDEAERRTIDCFRRLQRIVRESDLRERLPVPMRPSERLEAYLEGRMPPQERLLFEAEAEVDARLRRDIDRGRRLMAALRYGRQAALQRYLQRHTTRRLTGNIWGRQWTLISAGVLVVALIGFWLAPDPPPDAEPTSLLEVPLPPTSARPSEAIDFRRLNQWKREAVAYRQVAAPSTPFHLLFFPADSVEVRKEKNALLIYGVDRPASVTLHTTDSTIEVVVHDSLRFHFRL